MSLTAENLTLWPDDCPTLCHCSCIADEDLFYVNVDCSGKGLTKMPTMFPREMGFLDLKDNFLTNIDLPEVDRMFFLKGIDLENNFVEQLNFKLPPNLTILKLANNNLTRFFNPPPKNFFQWTLSNNFWKCDCSDETLKFWEWMIENQGNILDINETTCRHPEALNNKVLIQLSALVICPNTISIYIIIGICTLAVLLLSASSIIAYNRYRYHIKVWCYSRGITWLKKEEERDKGKLYDAFISAANEEFHLVKDLLFPELEGKEPHYVLYEPRRNMMAGEMFQFEKEMEEVTKSKRVIILLSENYFNDRILMQIFKFAFGSSLEDKLYRLILIAVGELPPLSSLDQSLKAAIDSSRMLHFDQKLFWEMLRFAMPKKEHNTRLNINMPKKEIQDAAV